MVTPSAICKSYIVYDFYGWNPSLLAVLHQLKISTLLSSVADPDPGSGAFLPLGSGILLSRIRDGAMVGSGSGIKHPGSATLLLSDG
jgi:hypothetical protein